MMEKSVENLRILGAFYYVVAVLASFIALIPIIHLTIGTILFSVSLFNVKEMFPLTFVGGVFIAVAGIFILLGASMATALCFAGSFLRKAKHYHYCLVMGGVACILFPWGTILGVFTFINLSKPEVKALFESGGIPGSKA